MRTCVLCGRTGLRERRLAPPRNRALASRRSDICPPSRNGCAERQINHGNSILSKGRRGLWATSYCPQPAALVSTKGLRGDRDAPPLIWRDQSQRLGEEREQINA